MAEYEVGGIDLARIHSKNNDKKFFCHFTGFLEGILASGAVEVGEVKPLLEECVEFVNLVSDCDADDIIQDFEADLLEHEGIQTIVEIRSGEIDAECEKSRLNRFLGYCRGIACDGVITIREIKGILDFLEKHPELTNVVGVKQIQVSCSDAIQDGVVDPEESLDICTAIEAIVGDSYADTGIAQPDGVANNSEYRFLDFEAEIEGANFVFTGMFKTSPRRLLEDELKNIGAVVLKSVSGKTDFIVVGGNASRDWVEMNRGTKIRKAQELRLKSDKPEFISEHQLLMYVSV